MVWHAQGITAQRRAPPKAMIPVVHISEEGRALEIIIIWKFGEHIAGVNSMEKKPRLQIKPRVRVTLIVSHRGQVSRIRSLKELSRSPLSDKDTDSLRNGLPYSLFFLLSPSH